MEKAVLEKNLAEAAELLVRNQPLVAEKKARQLVSCILSNETYEQETYINAVILLSEALIKSVKYLLALEELEKALKILPFELQLLEKTYYLCVKLKRTQRAEAVLKMMVRISPGNSEICMNLVNHYLEKGENIEAIIELKKLICNGKYDTDIYRLLISLLGKEKLYSEQLNQINILQKFSPNDMALLIEEARALKSLGKHKKSLEIINSFLKYKIDEKKVDLEFAETLSEFSALYEKQGFRGLLLKLYIEAISLDYPKLDKEVRKKLEQFSKNMKQDIIFNILCNPRLNNPDAKIEPSTFIKLNPVEDYDIIESIIAMSQNSNLKNSRFSIVNIIFKTGLQKLIRKELIPFLYLLIEK